MRYKMVRTVDNEATGMEWRGVRKEAGVSLRSLARTMGVSAAYLSDLERGKRNWTEELEYQYASALQVQRAVDKGIEAPGRDSRAHRVAAWAAKECTVHDVVRFLHEGGFTVEREGRVARADLVGKLLNRYLHDQGSDGAGQPGHQGSDG